MATVSDVKTVNITINDQEIAVPQGELIVESVKRLGLEIPIFCYHPRMKPVGMCRMCLVEVGFKQPDGSVRKMPKPQAGCTLPASEGMVVFTDTEMVHRDRKGVLEFLLINHPLDCPICDRGGECPLQNNTLFYGPSTSRFVEIKRHAPKAFPLSKYVTLDLERCIQCGRCVRFTEEISGDSELAFRFRGAAMQPSTFELRTFESKFSGNVIEICPVGALTNAKYRFRARPWDLETRPGICTLCSNGCNVWMDYRVGKVVRINGRTNEAVNEEWTCDRGKFGHDFYNGEDRLTKPLVRLGEALVEAPWAEAYREVLREFVQGGDAVAAIGGAENSNEDLYLLKRLFERDFGSRNLDHRFERHLPAPADRLGAKYGVKMANTPIAAFETAPAALVFATSLADDEPILFLRLRKGWFHNGTKVVVATSEPTDVDSFAHLVLRYRPGTEATLAEGLRAAAGLPGADARLTVDAVAEATGVKADDLRAAAALLKEHKAPVITTRGLFDLADGPTVVESLAAFAMGTGGAFNCYARKANEQGADLILDPQGKNTHEILEDCASGQVRALWLVNVDPFEAHPDRALVERALENVGFLVVQAIRTNGAVPYASVVLPQAAPAESDGTFTNLENRVQRLRPVLDPKGDAKPAWRIFSELSLRVKPETPFFNPGEVMVALGKQMPAFAASEYGELDGEGVLI